MFSRKSNALFALIVFVVVMLAGSLQAQVEPDRSGVGQAGFRASGLTIETRYRLPNELPDQASAVAAANLAVLGLSANAGRVDVRSGRWATLMLSEPLLPGRGKGNNLNWANLGQTKPKNDTALSNAASQAFHGFLEAASQELRIDTIELANPGKTTVHGNGSSIQIYVTRVFNGIKVRGNYLTATINHGNLTLFGTNKWGDINTSVVPSITQRAALEAVQSHVGSFAINGSWQKSELQLIPLARGKNPKQVAVGQGYDYRLAWVIRPAFDGDMRHFEALVDAHSSELLSFEDTNQYAEVVGGVYPVTNDQIAPDGVEQPGWPMPYQDITLPGPVTLTTDTGGNVAATGSMTATLSGPFVNINDNCGAHSLTDSNGIDWGSSGGTNCVTPGFGGAGNTHASRTGFYELNKIIEMGRGQLPGNTWLQQQLTSNMNINLTCNAFWGGGTVNFYRAGGGCFNTGEIAGVFDHEWGHGLDDNDALPTIASPSGEGIADIYTALRLNTSCIGRNFRATNCSGFGDPCLNCTGVRDIDYAKRQSGNPHTYTWSNSNCGGSVHCVGAVYAEAVWSLWKRELQSPPYNMDNNTAHEVVNRLTYIGGGNTGTWFSGGPPNGGCASNSGYMNYLAADDDNGNLNDGTPHMTAIFNAFNDQQIACGTPTVQDSGCAGSPTTAPTVTAVPYGNSVDLSWNAVTNASNYEVFRTEGVFGCDFGKVKVAETAGLSFSDTGLQNDREYSYVVIPKGSSAACFGPASICTSSIPVSGPDIDVDASSVALEFLNGDDDEFVDNCEAVTLSFDIFNSGLGDLTNARIIDITVISHTEEMISTSFPVAVTPSTLAEGTSGTASLDFIAAGLAFGETLEFEVTFTADELGADKTQTLSITNTETDLQSIANHTWDFETGLDGWTVIQGTFNRTTTSGGGGNGSDSYLASSTLLDNQCDQVRSPAFQLTDTSTLTLQNNYQIEHFDGQWWDRANMAIFEGDSRNAIDPDSGRLYEAAGGSATCVTTGQNGWADSLNNSWGSSSWTAAALDAVGRAGNTIQLDVAYGTDGLVNGKGFWFDEVTVTDIEFLLADGQSDICDVGGCLVNADCDDGAFCNGAETCNVGTGLCEAGSAPVCEDDLFCNGSETCNETTDSCDAGTAPICDDGTFCNGTETCNEGTDSCDAGTPPACDNGQFCDGTETCNEGTDSCDAGTPQTCDDGVSCTVDSCNTGTDSCDNVTNDSLCDDGAFCNGAETCDKVSDCQAGSDPCVGESCDETGDMCLPQVCDNDGICEAGEDCGNCANDCIGGAMPGAVCGNDICEAGDGENGVNCPADCNAKLNGKPSNRFTCGDGGGPNPVDCSDSRCMDDGFQCTDIPVLPGSFCCGDLTCGGPEDSFSCEIDCGPAPFCGDDIAESPEVCDGTDLGGLSCSDFDFTEGTLGCLGNCSDFDTSGCTGGSICTPKNNSCSVNSECCSGVCKNNGKCR